MKYFFIALFFAFIVLVIYILLFFKVDYKNKSDISAYFNANGSFAGFIQNKNGLIRACEFSTNGSILSCSKWFDDNMLQQGQNEGITQKNI